MTIDVFQFVEWVADRESKPLRLHIKEFLAERGINPTRQEVSGLTAKMYYRMQRAPSEYRTIIYTPRKSRLRYDSSLNYSGSTALVPISEAISRDGYDLPQISRSLVEVNRSHQSATVGQQVSVVNVVRDFNSEIALQRVKRENAEEIARIREEANKELRTHLIETRRMNAFLLERFDKSDGIGNKVM